MSNEKSTYHVTPVSLLAQAGITEGIAFCVYVLHRLVFCFLALWLVLWEEWGNQRQTKVRRKGVRLYITSNI